MRRWAERRIVVLAAAAVLFAVVLALRQSSSDPADATGLLYVAPVLLVAIELGLWAGVAAAALSLGLVGIWAVGAPGGLGAAGLLARAGAFLVVGLVAGRFGDRMRDARDRQHLLLQSGLALAHLGRLEALPTTLVERVRQLVPCHGARAELSGSPPAQWGVLEPARELVAVETRGVRYGTLSLGVSRPLAPEDRAALSMLALQAAVAAENGRLLEAEHDRAVIGAELQDTRLRLADRGRQLRELIHRQEAERHQVADELHEQAAQTLAAVLLGLAALERELGSEIATPKLGALRSDVDSTLRSLRSLAVSLRPPALALGLEVALERLAADARDRGFGEIAVEMRKVGPLNADLQTMAYRVVEEALDAAGPARSVMVCTRAQGGELVVAVEGVRHPIGAEQLALLAARMELVDGRLSATANSLRAVMPLANERDAADMEPDACARPRAA